MTNWWNLLLWVAGWWWWWCLWGPLTHLATLTELLTTLDCLHTWQHWLITHLVALITHLTTGYWHTWQHWLFNTHHAPLPSRLATLIVYTPGNIHWLHTWQPIVYSPGNTDCCTLFTHLVTLVTHTPANTFHTWEHCLHTWQHWLFTHLATVMDYSGPVFVAGNSLASKLQKILPHSSMWLFYGVGSKDDYQLM